MKYQHHMCHCRRAVSDIVISSVDIVVAAAWAVSFFVRGPADTTHSIPRLPPHTFDVTVAQWPFLRVRSRRFLFVFQFTRQQILANHLDPVLTCLETTLLTLATTVMYKYWNYSNC